MAQSLVRGLYSTRLVNPVAIEHLQTRGPLYGAVLDCQALVHPQVHLLSTLVADATPSQMRSGFCRSTGGTDILCVTRHMVKHKVRRAVLLSDGFVGEPDTDGRAVLARARLGVAYTGRHTSDRHLGAYANASAALSLEIS